MGLHSACMTRLSKYVLMSLGRSQEDKRQAPLGFGFAGL